MDEMNQSNNEANEANEVNEVNNDNGYESDGPAEADIDLDNMDSKGVDLTLPVRHPLTEEEKESGFILLTEDGGIKKKLLKKGDENSGNPPKNSNVICHYSGTLAENGEKFDSSIDRDEKFQFKIGTGRVIKGWDIGIASMNKNEQCILRCASEYAYGENGSPPKIPPGATLDFEVELFDWDDWQEVDGHDNDIKKKILIQAKGNKIIKSDAKININWRGYIKNDEKEITFGNGENIEIFADDDCNFTDAFHFCLLSMQESEKSIFKILNPSIAYGAKGNKDLGIEPNSIIFYQIQINSVENPKEKYEYENEERVAKSQNYKNEGNELFKNNLIKGAIKKYEKSLDWVDIDFSDEKLSELKKNLEIACNNNLSLIYLKNNDFEKSIEYSTKVLERDENNIKAWTRKGNALLNGGNWNDAKQCFKIVLNKDKNNSLVKKLLKIANNKIKEYNEEQRKLYSSMFKQKKRSNKKKKVNSTTNKEQESKQEDYNKVDENKPKSNEEEEQQQQQQKQSKDNELKENVNDNNIDKEINVSSSNKPTAETQS